MLNCFPLKIQLIQLILKIINIKKVLENGYKDPKSVSRETSKKIWKSMSNWHLYSNNPTELNRKVQPPWSTYFIDVFSRVSKSIVSSSSLEIERVSIPNFYFTDIAQKGRDQITPIKYKTW